MMKEASINLSIDTYITEDKQYCIYCGGNGDSGINVKGNTPEECAKAFVPYLMDYLSDARRDQIINVLREKIDEEGEIDLTGYDIALFDGDTDTGESHLIETISCGENSSGIETLLICMDNDDIYEVDDLTLDELELIAREMYGDETEE